MLGRLADVIYWLGICLGAILEIAGWVLVFFVPADGKVFGVICIVAGLIVYGIGRAFLYVIAAR